MTFAEKLQTLRKSKGLSQEQLAAQMEVSRQAVSKWELGESLPDIENVLRLGKLFAVSTDYLLKNEMTGTTEKAHEPVFDLLEDEKLQKAAFTASIGTLLIGLLCSLIGWKTWQTPISVGVGLLVQLMGLIFFELSISRVEQSKQRIERSRYYSSACWLFLPIPVMAFTSFAFTLYPRPYLDLVKLLIAVILYCLICLCITLILRRFRNQIRNKKGQ